MLITNLISFDVLADFMLDAEMINEHGSSEGLILAVRTRKIPRPAEVSRLEVVVEPFLLCVTPTAELTNVIWNVVEKTLV